MVGGQDISSETVPGVVLWCRLYGDAVSIAMEKD